MEGHCMKCKKKTEMKEVEEVTMKNGGTMAKGTCTECGGKMCAILGKKGGGAPAEAKKEEPKIEPKPDPKPDVKPAETPKIKAKDTTDTNKD